MPQLDELGFVLAPSFRSRAYVQYFVEQGLKPHSAFTIGGEEWTWDGPDTVEVALPDREEPFIFHPREPAKITAARAGWKLIELPNEDVNSPVSTAEQN